MLRVLWSRLKAGQGCCLCRGGRTRRRVLVGKSFLFFVLVLVVDGDGGWDGLSVSAVDGGFDRKLNDDDWNCWLWSVNLRDVIRTWTVWCLRCFDDPA